MLCQVSQAARRAGFATRPPVQLLRNGADAAALLVREPDHRLDGRATDGGLASLGDLALFYQVFSQGQRLLRTALGSVGEMCSNLLFLETCTNSLALCPRVTESRHPVSPVSECAGNDPVGKRELPLIPAARAWRWTASISRSHRPDRGHRRREWRGQETRCSSCYAGFTTRGS